MCFTGEGRRGSRLWAGTKWMGELLCVIGALPGKGTAGLQAAGGVACPVPCFALLGLKDLKSCISQGQIWSSAFISKRPVAPTWQAAGDCTTCWHISVQLPRASREGSAAMAISWAGPGLAGC